MKKLLFCFVACILSSCSTKKIYINNDLGNKKDSVFYETKIYRDTYNGLDVEFFEKNTYNSSGKLAVSEKSLKNLIPETDSYFNFPIIKGYYINGKLKQKIEYKYSLSLRNILIHVIKIYLSEGIQKKDFQLPGLIDYSNYKINYKDHKLVFDSKKNKYDSTEDVAQILKVINLRLEIVKNFEYNQWMVSFEKNNNGYNLSIYDDTGITHLEKNKSD